MITRPGSFVAPFLAAIAAVALLAPTAAIAHGGDKAVSAESEIKQLSIQPARVLAQQALVTLRIRNDAHEASVRLTAALRSKDSSDVDVKRLRRAAEALDAGNSAATVPLLDEALSRPLGSERGKALHEAGREFTPGTGAQEIVGIALGGALLLLGVFGLWRARDAAMPL
jgi:hypothetical protein